jgi:prevent-host-death family protein
MREAGACEAKKRLGALPDRVERGEKIVIARRGRPVAKLVPAEAGCDQEGAPRRAVACRSPRPTGICAAARDVTVGGQ